MSSNYQIFAEYDLYDIETQKTVRDSQILAVTPKDLQEDNGHSNEQHC